MATTNESRAASGTPAGTCCRRTAPPIPAGGADSRKTRLVIRPGTGRQPGHPAMWPPARERPCFGVGTRIAAASARDPECAESSPPPASAFVLSTASELTSAMATKRSPGSSPIGAAAHDRIRPEGGAGSDPATRSQSTSRGSQHTEGGSCSCAAAERGLTVSESLSFRTRSPSEAGGTLATCRSRSSPNRDVSRETRSGVFL